MGAFRSIQKRILVYFLVPLSITIGFLIYAVGSASTFSFQSTSPIILGLSIVEQDPSTILDDLHNGNESQNITSFLLQSSNPAAQIFLDYIYIPDNKNIPVSLICFDQIVTTGSYTVPTQLFSESDELASLKIEGNNYVYEFQDNRCAQKGIKHVVPHILLGIVPVDSYANLLFWPVKGFQASHFYPFDQQKIDLNITIMSDEFKPFSPSLEIVVAQKGWDGSINYSNSNKLMLHLLRPWPYKWIFVGFFLVMVSIIPFLNSVVGESGSFFEVAFGLLLGLWGMHQLLVPAYINSSILIDVAIYILYVLVIGMIVESVIFEYQKRKVQIRGIDWQSYNSEHVIIENTSYLPINLTGWLLLDKAGNIYKFPKFFIAGRSLFGGTTASIKIWTKDGMDTNTDLHWGKQGCVWGGFQDTAYLHDTKGEIISAHNKE